jgi:hypothetical protein
MEGVLSVGAECEARLEQRVPRGDGDGIAGGGSAVSYR